MCTVSNELFKEVARTVFFSFFFKSWPLETNYCDRDLKVTDYPIHFLCISDSQTFYLNLVSNTVGVWLEALYIQRFSPLQLQVSLPPSRRNPNRECKLKKTIYITASKKLKQPPYKISVPAFRLARFSLVFIKGSTVVVLILKYLFADIILVVAWPGEILAKDPSLSRTCLNQVVR
jgi:hypothetical protein